MARGLMERLWPCLAEEDEAPEDDSLAPPHFAEGADLEADEDETVAGGFNEPTLREGWDDDDEEDE